MPLSHAELYAQKQFRHKLGYALFDPNPGGLYDEVRVGDVGYVEDGAFIRLFNAFHDAYHVVNNGAHLPVPFAPIADEFTKTRESGSLSTRLLYSESVRNVRAEGRIGAR